MDRKVRIASLINELLFGGDENRLLSFSRTVNKSEFLHDVVCVKQPNNQFDSRYGTMRDHYKAAGVRIIDLGEGYPNLRPRRIRGMAAFRRVPMLARAVARFCRFIRANEIDVIDAHLGSGSLVGTLAGTLTGVPVVITTYHAEAWEPLWLWRQVHPAVLRGAAAVITDSTACARQVESFMGRPAGDVVVIPNGIDPPAPTRPREEVKRALGVPEDPSIRVVAQIATLLPTKGQDVLLEAASLVLRQHRNVFFLLVGYPRDDASYADAVRQRAARLGIEDHVRICGYPGDIGDVWSIVDIHAHPTQLDSLPQAIMEAMSLGIPSVVTPAGGIGTMVENERTGLIVPARDPVALGNALLRLLREPETARRLGDGAQQRYRDRYTTAHMTRSLEQLFARLASAGSAAA